MHYLVMIENNETAAPLSKQQRVQLLEQMVVPTLEACAKLESEQKIVAGGVAAGAGSIMLVIEAASNEELNQLVQSLPAWGAMKTAVTPLQSFAERVAYHRETVERFNASPEQSTRDELHERLGQLRSWAGK
jgi:muconolactone delta-isomerase